MPDEGSGTKFSGYSDFQSVVKNVSRRVELAVDAYGHVMSCQSQGIQMSNESAVEVKKALVSAGMRLKHELRHNRHAEPFDEIWERWEGEDGFLARLRETDFVLEDPKWLDQYIDDVQTAAWHIGYTKAGTQTAADPEDDDYKVQELIK